MFHTSTSGAPNPRLAGRDGGAHPSHGTASRMVRVLASVVAALVLALTGLITGPAAFADNQPVGLWVKNVGVQGSRGFWLGQNVHPVSGSWCVDMWSWTSTGNAAITRTSLAATTPYGPKELTLTAPQLAWAVSANQESENAETQAALALLVHANLEQTSANRSHPDTKQSVTQLIQAVEKQHPAVERRAEEIVQQAQKDTPKAGSFTLTKHSTGSQYQAVVTATFEETKVTKPSAAPSAVPSVQTTAPVTTSTPARVATTKSTAPAPVTTPTTVQKLQGSTVPAPTPATTQTAAQTPPPASPEKPESAAPETEPSQTVSVQSKPQDDSQLTNSSADRDVSDNSTVNESGEPGEVQMVVTTGEDGTKVTMQQVAHDQQATSAPEQENGGKGKVNAQDQQKVKIDGQVQSTQKITQPGLAHTGSWTVPLALGSVLLVGVGAGFMALNRYRKL